MLNIPVPSLDRLREAYRRQSDRSKGYSGSPEIYPYWQMEAGSTIVVRFLPDGDEDNPTFWREEIYFELPFEGMEKRPTQPISVIVPCMEMWKKRCPVSRKIGALFNYDDPEIEQFARRIWKKRRYHFQGFVVKSPLTEESEPENPIRRFVVGRQLFQVITAPLNPEEEDEDIFEGNNPVDPINGYDFSIKKILKSGYADYTTSNWRRKSRPLNDEEIEAIEKYGLFNLGDYIPTMPDEDQMEIIHDIVDTCIEGGLFKEEWRDLFRTREVDFTFPPALKSNASSVSCSTATVTATVDGNDEVDIKPVKEIRKPNTSALLDKIEQLRRKAASGG